MRLIRTVVCLCLLLLLSTPLVFLGTRAAPPAPPDTTPPVANAGANQTVNQGDLVTFDGSGSTDNVGIVNYTWGLPGAVVASTSHFAMTFGARYVFDPVRPYVYEMNATQVAFVNLTTGVLEKTFRFNHLAANPMSAAVSPKGNYLVVGLPTGTRGYYYFGPYQSYLAGFDLVNRTEVGEVSVASDVYDVAPTDNGYAVISGGSGQWAPIQVVNLKTGAIAPGTGTIWQGSSIAMHPNGTRVYSVDGWGIGPANFHRFDFSTSAGITTEIGEAGYASEGGGDLWVTKDRIVASNGKVQLSQESATGDTAGITQLPLTNLIDAAFDPSLGLYAVADGSTLEFYDHDTNSPIGSLTLSWPIQAMAFSGHVLEVILAGYYVTIPIPETFLYGVSVSYRFTDAGRVVARLSVWDATGNFGTATTIVTVRDSTPPVAVAGANQTVIHGLPVNLNGSASTDNVGIASYWWTFVDRGSVNLTGPYVTYVFMNVGVYSITLHVMDAAGNQNTSTVTVTAIRDPIPPTANAGPDAEVFPGMTYTFDGGASTDNMGIASFTWTFFDQGPQTLSGMKAGYTFQRIGNYTVTLAVRDLDGNNATSTMIVHVVPVALTAYTHPTTHFQVGLPVGWAPQTDLQEPQVGTVDVLATGSVLQAGNGVVFVVSRAQLVNDTEAYLLSEAASALSSIQASDASAVVIEPAEIQATANGHAAVFGVSLESGKYYEKWAIVADSEYGREWVIVGTSYLVDRDTYNVVFEAVIASFSVAKPTLPSVPLVMGSPLLFVVLMTAAGAGLGAAAAVIVERLRRRPPTMPR